MTCRFLLPAAWCVLVLSGCSGGDGEGSTPDNCDLPAPEISNNNPVTAGTSIQLETPYVNNGIYHWTGPNGFESYDQNPVIPLSTPEMAGTYSLELGNLFAEECTPPIATTTVEVVPAVAPCTPNNNTATNSVFPTMSFYYVSGNVAQDRYTITANGSQGDMTLTFRTGATPTAGLYTVTSNPSTFDMAPNGINVSIVTGGMLSYYYVASTGNVYISYVDGKISATFCNLAFTGPDGGTNFNSSARVTKTN